MGKKFDLSPEWQKFVKMLFAFFSFKGIGNEEANCRVSLYFDILIESFISLCIIETVGAIFH
jgi:hypothetical protein